MSEKIGNYWIDSDPMPEGRHWQGMGTPGAHLRDVLDGMAGMLRAYNGEGTDADFDALDVDENRQDWLDGPTMQQDTAQEAFDSWALEIRLARWTIGGGAADGMPARVDAVLGTGGPHVELDVTFDSNGDVDEIELFRAWAGEPHRARSTDREAREIVQGFVYAFLALDA
jgi:hypothetical protein